MLISLLENILETFICYLLVFMTIVIIASPSLNAPFSPSKEKIHPFLLLLSLPAIILIIKTSLVSSSSSSASSSPPSPSSSPATLREISWYPWPSSSSGCLQKSAPGRVDADAGVDAPFGFQYDDDDDDTDADYDDGYNDDSNDDDDEKHLFKCVPG